MLCLQTRLLISIILTSRITSTPWRLRDDIFAQDTMYTEYVVQNGERPEQVCLRRCMVTRSSTTSSSRSTTLWTTTTTGPCLRLSSTSTSLRSTSLPRRNEIHHYETVETFDTDGRNLVLKGGLVVSSDFIHYYRDGDATLSSLLSL